MNAFVRLGALPGQVGGVHMSRRIGRRLWFYACFALAIGCEVLRQHLSH